MKIQQTLLTAIALSMVAALVACSSGSSSTPPPPPPAISVSLSGAPASLATNATASITATVTNDSANAGVTWSCAPAGACGSFNPTSTTSGTATTYTAPATAGSVTVTATSVTDATKSAVATVAVTQALADGNYVFHMSGTDISLVGAPPTFNSPYFVAGMFTVSGGVITGGEQDFVDYNVAATDLIDPTASTIGINPTSGNLQITLTTCTGNTCPGPDTSVGVAGVETIDVAMISASKGRVVEFDTFATSSGTLDMQDTTAITALPSGGYAFAVQGIDSGGNPLAVGGILSMDGTGAVTSTSIFDQNRGGTLNPGETLDTAASIISGPDASGRIVLSLKPTNTTLPIVNFAGYIVDATHIRLAELADPSGSTLGGTALGQGTNLAVSGNTYTVGLTGFDVNGALHQAAALSLASGAAGVSGTITYNDLTVVQPAITISGGTYTADPTGRVTLTGVTDGLHTFDLQLYVDGNGNALALSMDTSDVIQGLGYQQTAGGTISGTYVMDATGADFTNEQEFDDVGLVTTGTGTFASASSGVDSNWLNDGITPLPASVTANGAFTSTGTGTGNTITGLDIVAPSSADAFDYYAADSTKIIAIENDGNQLTLIYFEQ